MYSEALSPIFYCNFIYKNQNWTQLKYSQQRISKLAYSYNRIPFESWVGWKTSDTMS